MSIVYEIGITEKNNQEISLPEHVKVEILPTQLAWLFGQVIC